MGTDNIQWTTVSTDESQSEETKVVFEDIGDVFIGTYLGMREIDSESGKYKQARFKDEKGVIYFINANYDLRQGLKDVRVNALVRIEFTSEVDTGQAQPMKCYRVQTGRHQRVSGMATSDNS
jgi:hypothetical protein